MRAQRERRSAKSLSVLPCESASGTGTPWSRAVLPCLIVQLRSLEKPMRPQYGLSLHRHCHGDHPTALILEQRFEHQLLFYVPLRYMSSQSTCTHSANRFCHCDLRTSNGLQVVTFCRRPLSSNLPKVSYSCPSILKSQQGP